MKYLLMIAFGALCLGCASTSGSSDDVAHPPRSAQYDVKLDWDYALSPGIKKYLGSMPLELGGVSNMGGITFAASTSIGKVIAIDDASARAVWSKDFDMPVTAGPIAIDNAIYIALSNGSIHKLNAKNGDILWSYDTGVAIEHGLSVNNGIVACINANNRAFALDANTGALKWRKERPKSQEFSMYGQAAPLIHNDIVYIGFSDGFLVAYSALNGTALWSRELAPEARFKDLDVTPVIVDNLLFTATSSGGLYALSADDGHTIWQRDIFGISSIQAFQDSIYLASQSGIFRIKRTTGETVWQNIIQKNALISPISLGKNAIYASVQKYGLVILNRVDGKLLHNIDMGSDFTSAPSLSPGVLTTFSNHASIYRFFVDDVPAG